MSTFIVTGGTRGIGFAVAARLLEMGHDVWACGRFEVRAIAASHRLGHMAKAGCRGKAAHCDVGDFEQCLYFASEVLAAGKGLHGLINCAGVYSRAMLTVADEAEVRDVIETNLLGTIYMSKACLDHIHQSGGGTILNVTSSIVLRDDDLAGRTVYAASKAGVNAFTRALADEMKGMGVAVNAVCPGHVRTDMAERGSIPGDVAPHIADLACQVDHAVTGNFYRIVHGEVVVHPRPQE